MSFHRFLDHLAKDLNVGSKLRVYHIFTPPVPTASIFASPTGHPDAPTTCESHFLTISQPHVITSATDDPNAFTNERGPARTAHVLVLGIEVLVFSTDSLTTVFVSKADSTGFLSRPVASTPGSSSSSSSIVKLVISAFLDWLVTSHLSSTRLATDVTNHDPVTRPEDQHPSRSSPSGRLRPPKRLVLSLFARSQNQYLFPGSIENTTKHVLDDRQLIKWWCRVLDDLVQKDHNTQTTSSDGLDIDPGNPVHTAPDLGSADVKVSRSAYVVVPGCDRTETIRSFFPPSARYPQPEITARWHNSYPVNLLVQHDQTSADPSLPVRCLIPRFPDDPKARYCDDLDNAGTDDKGQWKDIRSLQQFWEMMEYRQECAAGRLVGFVWVAFDPISDPGHGEMGVTNTTNRSETVAADSLVHVQKTPDATTSSRESVLLTNEHYNDLLDLLINATDFAGAELAVKSTCEWVDKVKELSGLQDVGVDVEGKKKKKNVLVVTSAASLGTNTTATAGSKHPRDEGIVPVNMLTGVRKKKQKLSSEPPSTAETITTTNESGTTISKSEVPSGKCEEKANNANVTTNGDGVVKTLSAGLIRKKPKIT